MNNYNYQINFKYSDKEGFLDSVLSSAMINLPQIIYLQHNKVLVF